MLLCSSGKSVPTLEYTETTFQLAIIRLSKLGKAVLMTLLKRSTLVVVGMALKVAVLASSGMVLRPMCLRLLVECLKTGSPGRRFLALLTLGMLV